MMKLHAGAASLVALALVSTSIASDSGEVSTAIVLAAAAAKGVVVLRCFLGIQRAVPGWRVALVGFVVLTCGAVGGIHMIGNLLHS